MKWSLILGLSFLGVPVAIITLFFSDPFIVLISWLFVLAISVFLILKSSLTKLFLNGFTLGVILNIYFLLTQYILYGTPWNRHGAIYQYNSVTKNLNLKRYDGSDLGHILNLTIIVIIAGLVFGTTTSVVSKLNTTNKKKKKS